jgi:hypothetical protein
MTYCGCSHRSSAPNHEYTEFLEYRRHTVRGTLRYELIPYGKDTTLPTREAAHVGLFGWLDGLLGG